nr:hypothetical protein [Tanacetum cinerariifolium]
ANSVRLGLRSVVSLNLVLVFVFNFEFGFGFELPSVWRYCGAGVSVDLFKAPMALYYLWRCDQSTTFLFVLCALLCTWSYKI